MSDVFDQIHADRTTGKTPAWGNVTGFEHSTGLPIIKRGGDTKKPDPAPEKPAAKPEAKEEKPEPKQDAEPDKPLAKGQKVKHTDGTTGTLAYVDKQLKIARVSKDGGGSMTAPLSKLSSHDGGTDSNDKSAPKGKILVKEHYRGKPDV